LRNSVDSGSADIDNFVLVRSDRSTSRGDGIASYVEESLRFSPIDLGIPPVGTLTDIVAVSLYLARGRVVIICVYPSTFSAFLSDLRYIESCLFYAACITDAIVCLGNFNTNVLGQTDHNAKLLLDIASLFSLMQLIDNPTRLTSNLSTILDLMFVLSSINVFECVVSDAISVSDHLTIYAMLAISRSRRPGRVSLSRNIHAIRPDDIECQLGLID
ncbi:hypothetical protein ALC57_02414, partial [Trachymyrmex cornetzi]